MESKKILAAFYNIEMCIEEERHNYFSLISILEQEHASTSCTNVALLAMNEKVDQEKHIRPKGYHENVIPLYSCTDFKSHFRLDRTTFAILLDVLHKNIKMPIHCRGKPAISIEKQALMTLWYLANQETMRSIADRFDLAKSSVHNVVSSVCNVLSQLKSEYIKWPTDVKTTAAAFQSRSNFPGVIGAIDGSHIPIVPPIDHQQEYLNRKMTHSVVLQAICDSNGIFTDCFVGIPGSRHDAYVLRQSGLYTAINNDKKKYFPDEHFHLVGDSAYPLTTWLLVPYKDYGDLSEQQLQYNFKHSQTRIMIEMSFGRLKGSYRRLKLIETKLETIPHIVMSACVLYNMQRLYEDDLELDIDTDIQSSELGLATSTNGTSCLLKASSEGIRKRNVICNELI